MNMIDYTLAGSRIRLIHTSDHTKTNGNGIKGLWKHQLRRICQ
jgi:hypothetical protein